MFVSDENTENPIQDFSQISEDDAIETVSFVDTSSDDDLHNDMLYDDTHHSDVENCFDGYACSNNSLITEESIEYDIDGLDNSERKDLPTGRNNDDNSIMFEVSALTVSEIMAMITGLCVRFNLSYEVRKAVVDLIKCLAGPRYET